MGPDLKLCQAFLWCVACKFILLPAVNCHDMLYILHALPTCFFDDVKPWEAKKLALCVLNWKQMKLSVSVCARFCVSVRCEGLF